jgi:hypothetical protein
MFKIVYCRSAQLSIFFLRRHQTPTPKTLLLFYSMKMVIVTGRVLFWQIIKVIGHFRWVLFRVSTRLQSTLSLPNEYLFFRVEWRGLLLQIRKWIEKGGHFILGFTPYPIISASDPAQTTILLYISLFLGLSFIRIRYNKIKYNFFCPILTADR